MLYILVQLLLFYLVLCFVHVILENINKIICPVCIWINKFWHIGYGCQVSLIDSMPVCVLQNTFQLHFYVRMVNVFGDL